MSDYTYGVIIIFMCDGITCKKDCDYYNKREYFK